MSVSERTPLSQAVYFLRLTVLAIIGLCLYADYLQTVINRNTFVATPVSGSNNGVQSLLPLSSYTPPKDGAWLLPYGNGGQ